MLTNMQSITKHIEIVWLINSIDGYGFGDDKQLYNIKTGRKIKQSMNCCSIGFWIGKKFITASKIKTMLIKPIKQNCPF